MSTSTGGRTKPRLRAYLLFLALAWAMVELLVLSGLCLLDRGWSPHARTQRLVQRAQRDTAVAAGERRQGAPSWAQEKRVHPYLGSSTGELSERLTRPPKRVPGKTVVGVFGGSLAVQLAVEGSDHFRRELERVYGGPVELVNLANSAFKQPQQLLTLTYLLSQGGELDVALSLDGFNEVALYDERAEGIHPSYPFGWRLRAASALTPGMATALAQRENARLAVARTAAAGTSWWSWLPSAQLYLRLKLQRQNAEWDEAGKKVEAVPVVSSPPFEGEPLSLLVDTWVVSAVQMDKLCRSNGITFYEFLQPNQYAPVSKPMGAEESRLALDPRLPEAKGARRGYPLLLQAGSRLTAQGVAYADLTPIFKDTNEPVYSDTCCHLNARGLQLLGEAVAGRLKPLKTAESRKP